jgi:hypothetical protein
MNASGMSIYILKHTAPVTPLKVHQGKNQYSNGAIYAMA